MSQSLFLGVDGGGTKTDFVLVDGDGNLIAAHQGPGAYHLEIGLDAVRGVLQAGIEALLGQAHVTGDAVAFAFFGLPAYGEDRAAEATLDAMPAPLLGHARYACGNDMICAWAGSLGGADGINVVAGTGSIAYGERQGRSARCGGWGELFGDEGSAFWIAVQGLNAFSRMSDGRLPRGPLHCELRAALGVTTDLDLCAAIANAPARSEIATLSRLVVLAAQAGDATATAILANAGRELASLALTLRVALGYEVGEAAPLSTSGGVFEAGALVLNPFLQHLGGEPGAFRLQAPLVAPSGGAAIQAARLAAEPLSAASITRLAKALGPQKRSA